MPVAGLLAAIEAYGFCDGHGHPLRNCAEFRELVRRLQADMPTNVPGALDEAKAT